MFSVFIGKNATFLTYRLTKEKSMYEQEAKKLAEKVEKMKVDKKDEYDIRKQVCFWLAGRKCFI